MEWAVPCTYILEIHIYQGRCPAGHPLKPIIISSAAVECQNCKEQVVEGRAWGANAFKLPGLGERRTSETSERHHLRVMRIKLPLYKHVVSMRACFLHSFVWPSCHQGSHFGATRVLFKMLANGPRVLLVNAKCAFGNCQDRRWQLPGAPLAIAQGPLTMRP